MINFWIYQIYIKCVIYIYYQNKAQNYWLKFFILLWLYSNKGEYLQNNVIKNIVLVALYLLKIDNFRMGKKILCYLSSHLYQIFFLA